MSITKSYNKHTDTYYAYDTTYIWSEEHQKKSRKRSVLVSTTKQETLSQMPNGDVHHGKFRPA